MLNTKFDLYNAEWLDVVFDDRNKAYGAYDLRNHYAGTLNKAMAIAFTVVVSAAVALNFAFKIEPSEYVQKTVVVDLPSLPIAPPKDEIKKSEPVKHVSPPKQLPAAATTKLTTFVVTSKPVTEEPPIIEDIKSDVGSTTTKGTEGPSLNVDKTDGPVGPPSEPAANGDEIAPFGGVEVNPEPYGGMASFGKFLGRNMRFPGQAQDAGVSGRVLMSFVVEKNGEISNIHVDREAGYGFDQEAVRVLKLAKAWKPGMQNGQPVRVRYSIPINFQLPTE